MALTLLRHTRSAANGLSPGFVRDDNSSDTDLVILCYFFEMVWRKFSQSLRVLCAPDVVIGNADSELLIGAASFTNCLNFYNAVRIHGPQNIIHDDYLGRAPAIKTLNTMLPGVMVLMRPSLLAFTLANEHEDRTEANTIAHPSLETISEQLDTVDQGTLDVLMRQEGQQLKGVLCEETAMQSLQTSVESLRTISVTEVGQGGAG